MKKKFLKIIIIIIKEVSDDVGIEFDKKLDIMITIVD